MPQDIAVARPFVLIGSDGEHYEYGIALYPQVSDAVADHWYTKWHLQDAVQARDLLLFQWRQLLVLDAATGTYQPSNLWAPIFLDPTYNPQYTATIEPNWPPIFSDLTDTFPMEHPKREFGSGESLGFFGYGFFGDSHSRPLRSTTKVFPGAPSPPILLQTDANLGRARREERAHFVQQWRQRWMQAAMAKHYVDMPTPDAAPIPYVRHNPLDTYVDQRELTRRAA